MRTSLIADTADCRDVHHFACLLSFGASAVSPYLVWELAARWQAEGALPDLDTALTVINTARATLGASINRLTHAIDNLNNVAQNTTESRSKIADTDYAQATSDLARQQIIQQAGTAMLAQANQMPSMVLALLR
jgi:flagellin